MNRKPYAPEIYVNLEMQSPIAAPRHLLEVRETLYEDRVTTWYEYVPNSYREGTPMPLVLQMHGGGGDGLRDAMETDWHRVADKHGFIVIYPNSYRYGRWECDEADVETIRRLIERVCQRYSIDRSRIYMQGMSNGEMITTAFVLEHPELLAAAGFIAGPLPADMLPHPPKGALPCIQIRGEKDVRFPHQNFERGDVYEPKSAMNDFNRCMWMEANHTEQTPEAYLLGKDNFLIYRGPSCDLVYWEVKDMGHRYPPCVPDFFWCSFYSGWRKLNGKSIRCQPEREMKVSSLQFAVAVGGKGVFQSGHVSWFSGGEATDCLRIFPTANEPDPYYDVGEMLLTPSVYAPIEALGIGFGASVELEKCGKSAVIRRRDSNMVRLYQNSCAVQTENGLIALKKPCLYRFGLFFVPVEEVASEVFGCFTWQTDGVVAVSDRPVELTRGAARILAHQLRAPARYAEPDVHAAFAHP